MWFYLCKSHNYHISLFPSPLRKVSFPWLWTQSPIFLSHHILETVFLKHNSNHATPVLENLQKSSFPTRQLYFNIQIKCFFLHATLSNSLPLIRSYCFPLSTWQPLTSYNKCLYLHYIHASSPYWRTSFTVAGPMSDSPLSLPQTLERIQRTQ